MKTKTTSRYLKGLYHATTGIMDLYDDESRAAVYKADLDAISEWRRKVEKLFLRNKESL